MTQITRRFSLRRFGSASDPDYPAALNIYVNNVPAEARSNSNEITYWLDRSYREFGDEFIVCGFFVDREVAGYAQMSLLRSSRVLFFDYFVLHPSHRNLGECLQFSTLLRELIDSLRLEFDYLVGEVSFESAEDTPSKNCVRLVRLFKQMGFGVAQCQYKYPPLGQHQGDAGLRAYLVIWSQARVRSLSCETMCHILRAIYLEYYLRWYGPFAHDLKHYHNVLKSLFCEFERSLDGESHVKVNGIKLPLPPTKTPKAERTPAPLQVTKPLIIVGAFALFCGGFLYLQARVHLTVQELGLFFTAGLLTFGFAFALCYKETSKLFLAMIQAITKFFDKHK